MAENETAEQPQPTKSMWPVVMVGVAGLSAMVGFATLFSLWMRNGPPDGYRRLRLAEDQYLAGRPIVAGRLAEQVELDSENEQDAAYLPLQRFLVAAGRVAKANQAEEAAERRKLLSEAVPFLEEAAGSGFPTGRDGEGHRLLGEVLYETGRFESAADSIRYAIDQDLAQRDELLPLLANAELRGPAANAARALKTIDRYLHLTTLDASQRREGELSRIQALLALRRFGEAQRVIDGELAKIEQADLATQASLADHRDQLRLLAAQRKVDATVERFGPGSLGGEALVIGGGSGDVSGEVANPPLGVGRDQRLLVMRELADVLVELNRLHREARPELAAQARLLAARAFRCQGDLESAISQLTSVRQQRPFGAEGLAGGLAEMEMLAAQGRGEEALQTCRYVMRELGDPKRFDGSLVSLSEFKDRLKSAIERLWRVGQFRAAIDISRSLTPLFSRSEALVLEAGGYRHWAETTMDDGKESSGGVERSTAQRARKRFRAAGDAFHDAAVLEFNTEQYLPLLWQAIDAYQKGRHFSRSIDLLEPYLRYEQRRWQPRGLLAQGRALLAEGRPKRAIEALETCIIEFPRDPLRYDARLMAAHAALELENERRKREAAGADDGPATEPLRYVPRAKEYLQANLEDGELTPDSEPWRDSLFALAELLYAEVTAAELDADDRDTALRAKRLAEHEPLLREAIRHLDSAVQRYWPMPRAEAAAYLLARCHRTAARWADLQAAAPDLLDAAKRTLRQRTEQSLELALATYDLLIDRYLDEEEERRLGHNEDMMLRNCSIAKADTYFEMGKLNEAEEEFRAISLRYMNEPTALEAIMGQAKTVRQLGRPQAANKLVAQALKVLSRIPPEWDGRFDAMTRFDRAAWDRYLTWQAANQTS